MSKYNYLDSKSDNCNSDYFLYIDFVFITRQKYKTFLPHPIFYVIITNYLRNKHPLLIYVNKINTYLLFIAFRKLNYIYRNSIASYSRKIRTAIRKMYHHFHSPSTGLPIRISKVKKSYKTINIV